MACALARARPVPMLAHRLKVLFFILFKPLWRTVVASGGSNSSKSEGPGSLKPLWLIVVASGGSKSSTIGGLDFFRPLLRTVAASGGSKSSMEVVDS